VGGLQLRALNEFPLLFLGEWPRLPFTARIGRAHSDRARSASKKGTWTLPSFSLFFRRALRYTPMHEYQKSCRDMGADAVGD
jgi:hypothetical protein